MSPPAQVLSVVVPCYNEERTIGTLLERVLDSPWVQQIVVVDDGSQDGSRAIAESFDDERVDVRALPRNSGKGAAVRAGVRAAVGDFVIVQDADLEYDPAEYGVMLGPLLDGHADAVYGSRFVSGRPHRVLYFWHSMGNRFLTVFSNAFTNLNLSDMETCYKMFRRDVVQSIEIEEDRFGLEPEITAKLALMGCRIYEVGVSYSGRTYAEGKKIDWRDGVRAVICIVKYSSIGHRVRGRRPVRTVSS